jgi:hypothetical protein
MNVTKNRKSDTWTQSPVVRSLSIAFAMTSFVFSYVGCVSTSDAVRKDVPEEGTVAQLETYGAIDSLDTPAGYKEDFESKVIDKRFENELEHSPFAETKPSSEVLAMQEHNSLKQKELENQRKYEKRKLVKTSSKQKKNSKIKGKKIQRKNFVVLPGKKYKVAKGVSRQK